MTIEAIAKEAAKILTRQGFHAPTILMQGTSKYGVIVLSGLPSDSAERIPFMYQTGEQAVREHSIGVLRQVFFVSESWMGSKFSTDDSGKKRYVRPSLDPNRIEVLTITCFNPSTEESTIRILEVIRNSQHEIVELKKVEVGDGKGQDYLLPAFVAGYHST